MSAGGSRGIRDNLFVINAITNSVKNGGEDACDIQVFDVEKCFDSLWVQECVNTLYENGFNNDKLVLLFEETKNAQIAIKHQMDHQNNTYKTLSCRVQCLAA